MYYFKDLCMFLNIYRKMEITLTWLAVVGVTALLSGVLARASAVASSLCVIGLGPVAPLWLRDTGRIPAETPPLLEGPAGLLCHTYLGTPSDVMAINNIKHHTASVFLYMIFAVLYWLTDWNSSSSSDMPSNMKPPAKKHKKLCLINNLDIHLKETRTILLKGRKSTMNFRWFRSWNYFIDMLLLQFSYIVYLAYHCMNWLIHCEKSWHWTERAYCLPQNAGPGWWHWQGPDVNWLTYERQTTIHRTVHEYYAS